jgi:multiple sugar transport system ATP-binding protein
MTLGQRVAVLRDGVLQQCDTPQALFHHPVNLFVAAFIGSPSMNLAEATVAGGHVRFAGFDFALPAGSAMATEDRTVILGIRPSDFDEANGADPALPRIRVHADVVEELGAESHVIFPVDAPRVVTDATRAAADVQGDDDATLLADDQRPRFCARVDGRSSVAVGREVELAVATDRLHFFDPETGATLGDRALAAAGTRS